MIKYLILVATAVGVLYNPTYYWLLDLVAILLVIFSVMYYNICFQSLSGLTFSTLNLEANLSDTWLRRLIHILAAIVLLKYDYIEVFYFILPWLILNTTSELVTTLIRFKILEIKTPNK